MHKETHIEDIIRGFNKKGIRYLLIGRQAVMLYGAPLFSFDYDFWVHPADREKLHKFLEDGLNLEASRHRREKKPIVSFFKETGEKVDIFIFRNITNLDGKRVNIDNALKNARKIEQPGSDFYIMVPNIDDLIKLKRITSRPKDAEDIEYLKGIKKLDEIEERESYDKRKNARKYIVPHR